MPIDRFDSLIRSVKPRKPSLPLRRLVLDAQVLAKFVEGHWEPQRTRRAPLPGLCSAATAAGLEREVVKDLRELANAVQSMESELRATKGRVAASPFVDAQRVLGELRAPLRFLLGGRGAMRRAFEKLPSPRRSRSAYALATALEAHAALAEKHTTELARLGDFPADLPERARRLALSLREPRRDDPRRAKHHLRDALATLLMDRMRAVRAAVRFAFRAHPELVKQATSDYERKRRRKSRQKRALERSA